MKALLINGSPHEKGSTYTALSFVAEALEEEGIETEILYISQAPVKSCVGCRACKASGTNRCKFDDDIVNTILEKAEGIDAAVFGSPVYYASPNGHLLSVLDRVFFAGSALFKAKPGAAICAVRRGGATATLDVLQKYFTSAGMPVAPSTYWPMIHGRVAAEVGQDEEGVQSMKMIGKTIAWLTKCIAAGKAAGIEFPAIPGGEKVMTNFIR